MMDGSKSDLTVGRKCRCTYNEGDAVSVGDFSGLLISSYRLQCITQLSRILRDLRVSHTVNTVQLLSLQLLSPEVHLVAGGCLRCSPHPLAGSKGNRSEQRKKDGMTTWKGEKTGEKKRNLGKTMKKWGIKNREGKDSGGKGRAEKHLSLISISDLRI